MATDKDAEKFRRQLDGIAAELKADENPFVPMHVVFLQMKDAGFSVSEACKIIGAWMGAAS